MSIDTSLNPSLQAPLSFPHNSGQEDLSFPRKREVILSKEEETPAVRLSGMAAQWIPAFAGMTIRQILLVTGMTVSCIKQIPVVLSYGLTALFHPALRPITLGVLMFVALNLALTLGVTFSPLNAKFNFSYGNFLPVKLAMLREQFPPVVATASATAPAASWREVWLAEASKFGVTAEPQPPLDASPVTAQPDAALGLPTDLSSDSSLTASANGALPMAASSASGPDVLFLGTSQTNNGFIPSVFDQALAARGLKLRSFNLGLPNNRYDVMQAALQMHVQRVGKPRLVLVELSPSIQERDSAFYYLPALYYRTLIERDPAMAQSVLANSLVNANVKRELALSGVSALYQYRYTFSPVNLLAKASGKLSEKLAAVAQGGGTGGMSQPLTSEASLKDETDRRMERTPSPQRENASVLKKTPFKITPEMTARGWYPKDQSPHMTTPAGITLSVAEARKYYVDEQQDVNFDKLGALLAWCRQQDIPVVLVAWPNHPAFLQVFNRSALADKYNHGLKTLLAREHVPVINLNADIPPTQRLDEAGDFADPRHLTPEGAARFSVVLARKLLVLPVFDASRAHRRERLSLITQY